MLGLDGRRRLWWWWVTPVTSSGKRQVGYTGDKHPVTSYAWPMESLGKKGS
jgi:hypothetical protein